MSSSSSSSRGVGGIVSVERAAELLRAGEVVAFPTETVYGLGADARSDDAVAKIFSTKGRPQDNPLIVHVHSQAQLTDFVSHVPPLAQLLMDRFWPGPLTVILPVRNGALSSRTTAGLSTVGVRMPRNALAQRLIELSGAPIAAPSANPSGRPSPTCAQHVLDDYGSAVPVVDGGACDVGLESTIVDCTVSDDHVVLLRPGGLAVEDIQALCSVEQPDHSVDPAAPRAPGMKYVHYAPSAPVELVVGSPAFLQAQVDGKRAQGLRVGVFTSADQAAKVNADVIIVGATDAADLPTMARSLYGALRDFDKQGAQHIFVTTVSEGGLGLAIMNRLMKASGHRVLNE